MGYGLITILFGKVIVSTDSDNHEGENIHSLPVFELMSRASILHHWPSFWIVRRKVLLQYVVWVNRRLSKECNLNGSL